MSLTFDHASHTYETDGTTAVIQIGGGYLVTVDHNDLSKLLPFHWRGITSHLSRTVYAIRRKRNDEPGRTAIVFLHRFILNAGRKDRVDHLNHDGLDNRRSNLRLATASQNNWNARKRSETSSRFKGVCWDAARGKWMAQIKAPGAQRHLGRFASEVDAALAYDAAAIKHCGGFALTNFGGTNGQ